MTSESDLYLLASTPSSLPAKPVFKGQSRNGLSLPPFFLTTMGLNESLSSIPQLYPYILQDGHRLIADTAQIFVA